MGDNFTQRDTQHPLEPCMRPIRVVPLTADLLSAAVTLDQLCFGQLWTKEAYQRELDSPNSELLTLQSSEVVSVPLLGLGCFWAILEEAHITLLAIHPQYQQQGLGQLLLLELLAAAHRRGLERATLEVRVSNEPAFKLYQKFGFAIAGRRKGYYQDTKEDALILWRGDLHKPSFTQDFQALKQQIEYRLQTQIGELLSKDS